LGLKVWGKHDAQRTNIGNINSFNKQLTQRVYEQYVMQRAQIGMDFISKKMTFHEDATEEITETSFMVGRPKYKVYLQRRESPRSHAEQFFLQAEWQKNKKRVGTVALPQPIISLFDEEYFTEDKEHSFQSFRFRVIKGYTEYKSRGKLFRSHPNHQNHGPHYDWAVIKCPNGNVDLRFSNMSLSSNRRRNKNEDKVRNSYFTSYLRKKYGKDYVPARIMALYQDPVTGKDMAIVHACRPMMHLNAERSTVITESWHLQHYIDWVDANDVMKGKLLVPVYNPIPADQLVGRVRVYMETQPILESWDDLESSGHVIMATQRSTHWAKAFLSHETDSEEEEEESETESDT
jgi:hypothetical protein